MSMIKCRECGKELSDKARTCPNCGCPINNMAGNNAVNTEESFNIVTGKKRNSTLSTVSAFLALFTCTSPIGIITAVIDLAMASGKEKKEKHTGSYFAIIWGILFILIISSNVSNKNKENAAVDVSNNISKQEENKEDKTQNEISKGQSFENNGLKVTINDINLEFKDYTDEYGMYNPADGMKYIMVSFTFENVGDSDTYVSIYDFDCYADNTSCEQAYLPNESDFINTNLSAGRNISFQTYYTVPENAENIELEYTSNIWTGEKIIIKVK